MSDAEDLFWDCAAELYNIDGVKESTIFGCRCLRVESEFVALPANDSLWVKLPEDHVNDLIDAGVGVECKPNGRVFREWLAVTNLDEALWLDLCRQSIDFVRP